MSELEKERDDPIILDLVARVARLEERVNGIEKTIAFVKEKIEGLERRVEKVDNRTWWILATIAISIVVQVLLRLVP
jgi:polyhydroxyalkanoate synthesis regulator phasin